MKKKPLQAPVSCQGFTLIEIMTVIAIIGLLAGLSFAGYQLAMNKAATKNTITRIAGLQLGLEGYKTDNGEYPEAIGAEDTTDIKGVAYRNGAAKMLYQVMTGDGDSNIKGGATISTGTPGSTGKIYWEEVTPPTQQEVEKKIRKPMVDTGNDGSFFMIDGWRKPLQYVKAIKDRNKRISNRDEMWADADYIIWSYGKLETPKDDPESQKEWITSWSSN